MALEESIAEMERIAEDALFESVRILFRQRLRSEAELLPDYFGPLMLDFSETHSAPAPPSEDKDSSGDDLLSQFKTHRYNDDVKDDGEETDSCCVCLERLHRGLVATLHCHHEFHGGCIGRWLRRGHNFCPLCKARAIN